MHLCRHLMLTILTIVSSQDLCPRRPGKMPDFCTSFHIEVRLIDKGTTSPFTNVICDEEEKQFMNEKLEFYVSKFARLFFHANDLRLNNPLLEITPPPSTTVGDDIIEASKLDLMIQETLPPLPVIEDMGSTPDDDFLALNSSNVDLRINATLAIKFQPTFVNNSEIDLTLLSLKNQSFTFINETSLIQNPLQMDTLTSRNPSVSVNEAKEAIEKVIFDDDFIFSNTSGKNQVIDKNQSNSFLSGSPVQPISDKGPVIVARPVAVGVTSKIPTANPSFPRNPIFMIQTRLPTKRPVHQPSKIPTKRPTKPPTRRPSPKPMNVPTKRPKLHPTKVTIRLQPPPTNFPTRRPTNFPTKQPTNFPTKQPSNIMPTKPSTMQPTKEPNNLPTKQPTDFPTKQPTNLPTDFPTKHPTILPTNFPTKQPTILPTIFPTKQPTTLPTNFPTKQPTNLPTKHPTISPQEQLTTSLTEKPTILLTEQPIISLITQQTALTTIMHTEMPTLGSEELPTANLEDSLTLISTTTIPTPTPISLDSQRKLIYETQYLTKDRHLYATRATFVWGGSSSWTCRSCGIDNFDDRRFLQGARNHGIPYEILDAYMTDKLTAAMKAEVKLFLSTTISTGCFGSGDFHQVNFYAIRESS
jgi:hypothetical protein